MKAEFTAEAVKGTPAVAGAVASVWTLNTWIMLATGAYIVLQILYLGRKWWREESEYSKKKARKTA